MAAIGIVLVMGLGDLSIGSNHFMGIFLDL